MLGHRTVNVLISGRGDYKLISGWRALQLDEIQPGCSCWSAQVCSAVGFLTVVSCLLSPAPSGVTHFLC